jgi:hypothetical protein
VRERGRIAVWDVRRGRVARLEGTPQVYSNDPTKQWTAIIPDGARLAALGQDRRGVVPPAPVERIGLAQTFPTLPFAVGLIAHVYFLAGRIGRTVMAIAMSPPLIEA